MKRKAWLGLGGNLGDVTAAMRIALQNLARHPEIEVVSVSAIYKTPPWGVEDQPWFLNCCAEISTSLPPETLLAVCQDQEKIAKRERLERWGPRTLDIDVLIFEGVEQQSEALTLPHPRMLERAFVMIPLAEIAGEVTLRNRKLSEWARETSATGLETEEADRTWWSAPEQN